MASATTSSTIVAGGLLSCSSWRFRVCKPNQWLVKTGANVPGGHVIARTTFQWPYQTVTFFEMNPRNMHFELECMSAEMVPFRLPVVFTVVPFEPDVDMAAFERYFKKMTALTHVQVADIVSGIVHGEMRVLTATLTIQELFCGRDQFKAKITERVCKDLLVLGIDLLNINIEEMHDHGTDNRYFENLKLKALEIASSTARIQVAEARKMGDIGEAERRADATKRLAAVAAEVQLERNLRQQAVNKSDMALHVVQLECNQVESLRKADSDYAPKQRSIELEIEFNKRLAVGKLEALRASDLSAALVDVEKQVERARGAAVALRNQVDAERYQKETLAKAHNFTVCQQADGQTKAAAGILATMAAQASGLKLLAESAPVELIKFQMALDSGLFERLAVTTASAIHGLNPKINVWTTGPAEDGQNAFAPIASLFKSLPPMLESLQAQTNVQLPAWMPKAVPEPSA